MKTIPKTFQSIMLFVSYCAIIAGTMVYSGRVTQKKTLYDRFITNLEGVVFNTTNLDRSVKFYSEVLDLKPLKASSSSKDKTRGFLLPDNRKIFLNVVDSSNVALTTSPETNSKLQLKTSSEVAVLRVRNGFGKLHKKLVKRSKKTAHKFSSALITEDYRAIAPGHISEIVEQASGRQFVVKDHDGNRLIFYRAKKFLLPN